MKRNHIAGYPAATACNLQMFTDGDLERIHLSTLEVLDRVGVYFESDEAVKILKDAGAKVEGNLVKIPPYMVEEAIRTAPGSILLAGRDEKNDMLIEKGRVYFTTFGQGVTVDDPYTGEWRPSTKKDSGRGARLVDALEGYDFCFDMIASNDVHAAVECYHTFEAMATNTSKHIVAPAQSTDRCELLVEMGIAVTGSLKALQERPFFQIGGCPISPLSYPKDMTDTLVYFAKRNLPVHCLSMSMAGAMAPTTLAGCLVVHNADVLSGLVLHQAVQPGAPFIYASSTSIMWLKKANAVLGCPELGMINAGLAKITQMYNLPSFVAGS